MPPRRPKSSKNPAIFSHEFVQQNHADIVSCVAMVFVVGLMFQTTSPIASLFVAMQHNVTQNETEPAYEGPSLYTYGSKDVFGIFFYFLICVVVHAVIQEYGLDKLNRRMHLSKVKHSKFNESGQLLAFYAMSAIWGANIIIQENFLTSISNLWEGYPHAQLPFIIKFYFILQLAYWVHSYPELYFQKVKKDEMSGRVQYASLYLFFIAMAYMLNFSRVALCILVLHYIVEFVFHLSRLLYFAEKSDLSNTGFMVWNLLFVLVRLAIITLAVLTFWYGLEKTGQSSIDMAAGNFNTPLVRINCLAAVCLLQAWMMWHFITFHLRRLRERSASAAPPASKRSNNSQQKSKNAKKNKKEDESASDSGPDTDAAPSGPTENGTVRHRTTPRGIRKN
ncbi:hypothetical protein CAPTEDRAFT_175940 [Capitella teleta]|uniref:TLC domain-containing protein n=1 Tax=Capitella teleta TaxID=283909 RepID=R7VDZ5_CAPTE|nr:hypothetical protein CAPTEDRAFT_175940 [Capitella teleta]|eukprot:ELU13900.1 hypothetical protein CAPTEDRAFT_175940 [Capitella teleta]